jgi:hypothetical protein
MTVHKYKSEGNAVRGPAIGERKDAVTYPVHQISHLLAGEFFHNASVIGLK